MPMNSLEEVFVDKLKDIYDAERRITRALPKMAKAAANEDLANAFREHLEQTQGHIQRLEQIFDQLDQSAGRKPCHGVMGILEEGQEMMEKDAPEPLMDAALIAGAQEVEHYEMAAYGTLRSWAEVLGRNDAAKLLQQTLEEESETDEKLTKLAEQVNPQAMQVSEGKGAEEDEERMATVGTSKRRSGGSNGHRSSSSSSSRRSR